MRSAYPETTITTLDVDDRAPLDWASARRVAYLIQQRFHYEYPGRIDDLRQRLIVVPPERHGDQRLIMHKLEVSSPTTEVRREVDSFGNLVCSLSVDSVALAIDFAVWVVVERDAFGGPIVVSPNDFASPLFREASPLTQPDAAIDEIAGDFLTAADEPAALAERINDWVCRRLVYVPGVTDIDTTAAEALALGRGVCQDFAHLMLALCRACSLPARYVSGHLLGEGGTHAWVEVLLPDPERKGRYLARPFDPTHGCEPGLNYVTVAVGRDYADVAPTSGTFRAPYPGRLSALKRAGAALVETTDGDNRFATSSTSRGPGRGN